LYWAILGSSRGLKRSLNYSRSSLGGPAGLSSSQKKLRILEFTEVRTSLSSWSILKAFCPAGVGNGAKPRSGEDEEEARYSKDEDMGRLQACLPFYSNTAEEEQEKERRRKEKQDAAEAKRLVRQCEHDEP